MIKVAKQMGLAVVAQALAVGVDQLHGVVDLPVFSALRVTIHNRQTRALRQCGNRLRGGAIGRLGQGANRFGADVVAAGRGR